MQKEIRVTHSQVTEWKGLQHLQKLEETRNETSPWRFRKDHNPADTLISNFWAPEL